MISARSLILKSRVNDYNENLCNQKRCEERQRYNNKKGNMITNIAIITYMFRIKERKKNYSCRKNPN